MTVTHDQLQAYVNKITKAHDDVDSFHFSAGSKMFKVMHTLSNGQEMVHCFVEKETGDIFKAETWYRPAKGKRGNIFDENAPLKLGEFYIR